MLFKLRFSKSPESPSGELTVNAGSFSVTLGSVTGYDAAAKDNGGLSEKFFEVSFTQAGIKRSCLVWNDLSAVEFPMYEGTFEYPAPGSTLELRVINFRMITDYHDNIVNRSTVSMFNKKIPETPGNIFILEDPVKDEATVFISCAPDYAKSVFSVENGVARLENGGHGVVAGKCRLNESDKLCRAWYRKKCRQSKLFTLANNWGWGDFNAYYKRVCEDFVKKEIDASSELGLDSFQIDDGWQTGNTNDPAIRDENNKRTFYGDFWLLNKERFPGGMEKICGYAKEKGVVPGLWFAPHSKNRFELLDRDVSVLENAYKNWGIRNFKLDMINIKDMESFLKFRKMLDSIYSFGDGVSVQLDVTNGVRGGFFSLDKYGRIFVENRFTALSTAYPFRVMRNLWDLCRYIPAFKFQFELVDPALYADRYDEDDVLAPSYYDMDYLFAGVMFSNPLFWMATQFLPEKQREELSRVFPVWKEIREELAFCDVVPAGDRPDGASFTGFAAYSPDGNVCYLNVFREVNGRSKHVFELEKNVKSVIKLASNADISFVADKNRISVDFGKPRSYALFRIELQ